MKRVIKWGLIVLGALIAIFVIGGLLIPEQWNVSRSVTINAQPEEIYSHVSDLRDWQNWTSWTKEKDPSQAYTYEGEPGVGHKWLWTSEKMGEGNLEIKKADPQEGIEYELFIDMGTMQSTIFGDVAFRRHDNKTEVTWTDRGSSGNNLVKRWMSLMIGKMLGEELEYGLNNLKKLTEK